MTQTPRTITALLALLVPLLLPGVADTAAAAEGGPDAGAAVMRRHVETDAGWRDATATLRMTLREPGGGHAERVLAVRMQEVRDGGDRSLSVFLEPADVRGTALLTHSNPLGEDDQWLYLPSLRAQRRISSVNKSGPFLGSEFAFEDLSPFELDKYEYALAGEETIDGVVHDLVTMRPRDVHSGYDRIQVAVERDRLVFRRLTFHDRRGVPFKVQDNLDFELLADRYWRPRSMRMRNLRTGKETEVEWREHAVGVGVPESDFNAARLRAIGERLR